MMEQRVLISVTISSTVEHPYIGATTLLEGHLVCKNIPSHTAIRGRFSCLEWAA